MPLVYLNEMVKLAGLKEEQPVKERVQKAIERLFEMQDQSGAFGVWGPSKGDMWLTAYVADFLTRAKEAGFIVPARAFGQTLDRLQNSVNAQTDFETGGEDLAYALYVLARNGRAPMGELRYYIDTRIDRFATALAKTQLGAASSMMGDKERAERAFKSALASFDGKALEGKDDGNYRHDYGSVLRDGAAMLTLATETGMAKTDAPKLATLIGRALAAREYTSTQENSWMLLAARSLIEEAKTASLSINGANQTGAFVRGYTVDELQSGVSIVNNGASDVAAVVTVTGDAATPEPAITKGFTIERSYFTLDGKPVQAAVPPGGGWTLNQNDRLVVVLKVKPTQKKAGRLMIVDRLPAGLEIENPRLIDSASTKSLSWLEKSTATEHTEFRDDRFVAAINLNAKGEEDETAAAAATGSITLAYMVRAVSPGSYVHPAATVEDMYRPERFSRTASTTLVIKSKE